MVDYLPEHQVLGPPRHVGESLTLRLERLLYRWAYWLHRYHPERRHR